MYRFQNTGKDVYFDIQVTNEDPSSSVGRQTIILKDCNIDNLVLARFDADAEYLEDEFDFTFEGLEMRNKGYLHIRGTGHWKAWDVPAEV